MAQIQVTGYIDTDDMDMDDLDTSHPMGVSDAFFSANMSGMTLTTSNGQVLELTEVDFTLQQDR